MGIFYNSFLAKFNEAEVDGETVGEENPTAEDYTLPEENNQQESQPTPQEGETQNLQNNNTSTEEPPPEDYTNPEYTDTQNQDMPPADNAPAAPQEEKSEVDDIKKQEEELYNELSPEQLDIKHRELKSQYLKMYDSIIAIIDRLGDVNVAEENIGVIEYVSNTLAKLKEMLADYVNDVYKTKSYIENSINYNRFLVILNGVNKILEEMNSKTDKN